MEYPGFVFRQVANGPIVFVFVAPSYEIDRWAKVPTKMSSRPRGFQRARIPSHEEEVRRFFTDDTERVNTSPTTIILGLEPEAQRLVTLVKSPLGDQPELAIDPREVSETPVACRLRLHFEPWDSSVWENRLNDEIAALFAANGHRFRLPLEAVVPPPVVPGLQVSASSESPPTRLDDDTGTDDGEADGEADADSDLNAAGDTSDDPGEPDSQGESTHDPEEDAITTYFANLAPAQLVALCEARDYLNWTERRRLELRDILKDEPKPGLIIDGQHRLKGTSRIGAVPFCAALLPFASWGELAFQFIVNNGTARKVADGLLIAIVGQSLTPTDLGATEGRLNRAGIKVSLIQAVIRVHQEDNPFCGMLRFDFPGEAGFLDAPAMQKKVVQLWFGGRGRSGTRPSFRKLHLGNYRRWDMYQLFGNACEGDTRQERAEHWQKRNLWFRYFSAFWRAVSNHFAPRLWPESRDDWLPPTALNLDANQKEMQKLMRVTVLGLLQFAVLQVWADDQNRQRDSRGQNMTDFQVAIQDFETQIAVIIRRLPHDFFTALTHTGFDASKDLRMDLVTCMIELLDARKTFAELRQGHRFWA